ncbi:AEC family transporter [Sulfurovum sp. zt1-1]|uniref:AEC family transporter n=1 Tax=Sulfurovum zhangzhouensis TaxID=3019067 RepID=A0ABT7QUT9_9BACT|nr:AEC family transporter [Sulfurovum zhangzhouensis]MDM5270605.1 AEC family transporter [Sulfurovum zhangzhouensis]
MEHLSIIFIAIIIGIVFKRFSFFPVDTATTLNLFVIYVSLPAMILLQIPKLTFNEEILIPALVPWGVMALSALMVLALNRVFQWKREVVGSLLLVAVLGNTSFVGIPMVTAYFGDKFVPYALIYDQTATFIALAVYGSIITAVYGESGKLRFKNILIKILTFPPFITLVLGLMLNGIVYPEWITKVLEGFALTLIPLALVAVGFQLVIKLPKEEFSPFLSALAIKLIWSPFVAWGLIALFAGGGMIAQVTMFEAGMGPMITAGVMATLAGLAPRLTSAIVGLGTLIAFITLPVLHSLIH